VRQNRLQLISKRSSGASTTPSILAASLIWRRSS
jgi:hypothetical protein